LWRGVPRIALGLGVPERRALYLCERGYIPVGREGNTYIADPEVIFEFYRKITQSEVRQVPEGPPKSTGKRRPGRRRPSPSAPSDPRPPLAAAPNT